MGFFFTILKIGIKEILKLYVLHATDQIWFIVFKNISSILTF